jgi:hypothetical protein
VAAARALDSSDRASAQKSSNNKRSQHYEYEIVEQKTDVTDALMRVRPRIRGSVLWYDLIGLLRVDEALKCRKQVATAVESSGHKNDSRNNPASERLGLLSVIKGVFA